MATRWSASAASSAGRPQASLPNSQAVGPASGASYEPHLAGAVGGQHGQPGVLRGAHRGLGGRLDGERQVEERPDAGPDRLGVVGVDGAAGEHHAVGAGRVGAADHGAGVARVADVGADRDQPGAGERPRPTGTSTKRQSATTPAGLTESDSEARARSSTMVEPDAVGQHRAGRPGRANTSSTQPASSAASTALRAVGKEEPPLGADRAAARTCEAPSGGRCPPSRGVGVQAEASAWGALTSSGRAALATSTSALNAAMSLTARSARILRSTSTPARPRPWMNRL